jgi:hypothetical protein
MKELVRGFFVIEMKGGQDHERLLGEGFESGSDRG